MRPASILFTALFLCVVMFQSVVAQVSDQWIYNDTLVSPWLDESWNSTTTYNSTEHVYAGSNAIKAVQIGYGGLAFRAGEWGSPVNVNPSNYSHLEFAVYSVTAGLALEISVGDDVGDYSTPYSMTNFPLNQWVIVAVPMANINSSNMTFNNIYIGNSTALSNTYYVDAVRLVGNTGSTSAPPSPTLVTVDSNSSNQSKRPFLSWNLSSSATSYRLQVSTSSSFSTTVFDDSTLSLTLQKITNPSNITNLANSTTYYWRVRAKNSYGASSYSNIWHFTTSSPNTTDQWIYQDTLIPRWTTVPSWATTITLQQTAHVFDGTYSLKSEQTAYGAMFFRSGDWGPPVEVDPTDYDSLKFDFYTVTDGFDLGVYLFNESSEFTYGVNLTSLTANQWYHFSIPITSLAPDSEIISNIVFYNLDDGDGVYYVDDIRLLAHPGSGSAPSVPTLASPSSGAANQSSWAMLKWNPSDTTTIDYRLQVATDSNFSSVVFNDSTITDTSRMMTTLIHGTTYYWHVNAKNTIGSSGWSSKWHFTTQPDTIPTLVVAPVDSTVSTVLSEANKFLYAGSNAVQFGVDTSKLNPVRFSTIRGKVIGRDSLPIAGVRITILNHTEFGYTNTMSDGVFDMVVNGGGILTVNCMKDGYLLAQRQENASWQEYSSLEDIILVKLDTMVNVVKLGDSISVAQGNTVTDADGSRHTTLLFSPSTTATLVYPDTTISVTTLNVRATEYSADSTGRIAMPANLPLNSGYTYCTELTADEAISTGAQKVQFNNTVYVYVDNFINFPVGGRVPAGYYDYQKGVWIPSNDGRVIGVLDTTGGIASLDVHGDSTAADSASLDSLSITSQERQKIASMYHGGQSFWRVGVNHFTAWDFNWPLGPPSDATLTIGKNSKEKNKDIDNICKNPGSIIGIQNQTLGEAVGITGTPYSLYYGSDRVPGRIEANTIFLPLTGDTVPSSLKYEYVEATIAGRRLVQNYSPTANLTVPFVWDGKDSFGRSLNGSQPIHMRLASAYNGVYYSPAQFQEWKASFATSAGFTIQDIRSRGEIYFWKNWDGQVGVWDQSKRGLGGWSVDVNHEYDVNGNRIYFGNGDVRSASNANYTITTVAGNGESDFAGDSGLATEAILNLPSRVAIAPDGSVFFTDTYNNRVRKILPDGTIITIAGQNDTCSLAAVVSRTSSIRRGTSFSRALSSDDLAGCYGGDGGPATEAFLYQPIGIVIGLDGSIYIGDSYNNRVRKIDANGIITTFAGTGDSGYNGDGDSATNAELYYPAGLAMGPDGSLYIADAGNEVVRKVTPDGIITTFAGTATPGFGGDGGPATSAELLDPEGVAVGPDGSIYIADAINNRIRKVTPNGIIQTVVGSGRIGYDSDEIIPDDRGDGGPATSARLVSPTDVTVDRDGVLYIADTYCSHIRRVGTDGIITRIAGKYGEIVGFSGGGYEGDNGPAAAARLNFPTGVATGPDGKIYIADNANSCIRMIDKIFPGYTNNEIIIPSYDGNELYVFDQFGKHLRTQDALTGKSIYSFSYDSLGFLSSIRDIDSLVTKIRRDSVGDPLAIISPYRDSTLLSRNSNGYIASIASPAHDTTYFKYTSDGLMDTLRDPRGNLHTFQYDSLGRLTKDKNPVGGFTSLTRTELSDGYEVTDTSAEGRTMKYRVKNLAIGGYCLVNTNSAGLTTADTVGTDGKTKVVHPDGMVFIAREKPDPRFAMQVPLTDTLLVSSPAGLTSALSQRRAITELIGLETKGIVDSVFFNGNEYITSYDGDERLTTSTSPEGRMSFARTDTMGRVLLDSIPGISPVSYAYDDSGRPTSVSQGGRTSRFGYDTHGRLASTTDPLGRTSYFLYDSVGRVTRQILANGSEIDFSYDANGNVTGITPPGKPVHSFDHTANDLTQEYLPPYAGDSARATFYQYNLDNQLTKITRPDSSFIQIAYDTTSCSCGSLTGLPKSITFDRGQLGFFYDSAKGTLKKIITPESDTLTYTYDGSFLTQEKWSGDVSDSVRYTYDNNFRVTKRKINNSDSVIFSYDNDGLLKKVGSLSIGRSAQTGLLTTDTLGNVTSKRSYDSLGNLSDLMYRYSADTLYHVGYIRDSLSRITQQTETIRGVTRTFKYTYDTIGRLSTVKRNDTLISRYYYDPNGNRDSVWTLTGGTVHGTYDNQDRLLTYDASSYFYTKNGELSKKIEGTDTTKYTYDYLGNLTEVSLPNGDVIDYIIDGQNRRIGKKLNGAIVSRWIYSGQLTPVAEVDSTGSIVSRFVGSYLIKGDSTYRIVRDHLGSVRLVVNTQSGTIAQRIDYDEFGNVTTNTNSNFTPFGFAGGIYDNQIRLEKFGARDYDASLGRWTNKDPIFFLGGEMSLYGYVGEDPINWVDQNGLQRLKLSAIRELVHENNLSGQSDELIIAQIYAESKFNPQSWNSITMTGLMQVGFPAGDRGGFKYEDYTSDPENYNENSNAVNIQAGTSYLKRMIVYSGGDIYKGLEEYNGWELDETYGYKILEAEMEMNALVNPCDSDIMEILKGIFGK